MRRWLRRCLVAALVLAIAGCSIPQDDLARPIDDVPIEVLGGTTTTVEPVSADETDFRVLLYFYNDQDQLVVVERPTESSTPLLNDILTFLVANTEQEQIDFPGINTRLLPNLPLKVLGNVDKERGILTVYDEGNQYRGFETSNPVRVQRVFGQVVCTLLGSRSSDLVAVEIIDDDGPIRVQSSLDGSVIEGPVTREQVNDCKTAEDLAAEAAAAAEAAEQETGEGETDEGG